MPPAVTLESMSLEEDDSGKVRFSGGAGAIQPGELRVRVSNPPGFVELRAESDGSFSTVLPGLRTDVFYLEAVAESDLFLTAVTGSDDATVVAAEAGADGDGDGSPDVIDCAPTDETVGGRRCSDIGEDPCSVGMVSCAGECVDVLVDPLNCSGCGIACAVGATCVEGECLGDGPCPDGTVLCGGVCLDLSVDPFNCGICGESCAAGEICVGGVCGGPEPCPAGMVACSGECVDTSTDPEHCGVCDTSCMAGETCADSVCGGPCSAGMVACAGECVDLTSDTLNCGGCGVVCAAGESCVDRICGP